MKIQIQLFELSLLVCNLNLIVVIVHTSEEFLKMKKTKEKNTIVGASLSGDESALDVSRVSDEVLPPITCRVGKKDVSIFLMNEQLHPV